MGATTRLQSWKPWPACAHLRREKRVASVEPVRGKPVGGGLVDKVYPRSECAVHVRWQEAAWNADHTCQGSLWRLRVRRRGPPVRLIPQEVNTTAWDGDACDGVGGGVAGRDADGGGWDGTASGCVGGVVAGRVADCGGVVPLRLSMTMHTTDV